MSEIPEIVKNRKSDVLDFFVSNWYKYRIKNTLCSIMSLFESSKKERKGTPLLFFLTSDFWTFLTKMNFTISNIEISYGLNQKMWKTSFWCKKKLYRNFFVKKWSTPGFTPIVEISQNFKISWILEFSKSLNLKIDRCQLKMWQQLH